MNLTFVSNVESVNMDAVFYKPWSQTLNNMNCVKRKQ